MTAAAPADLTNLAIGKETTYATAPSGTYVTVRHAGETLGQDPEFIGSDEIESGRNTTDNTRVAVSAAGTLNYRLSYHGDVSGGLATNTGAQDRLFAAALFANSTTDDNWAAEFDRTGTVAVTSGGQLTSSSGEDFSVVNVGDIVQLSTNFSSTNQGYGRVGSKTSSTVITIDHFTGTFATQTATAGCVVTVLSQIKNGTQQLSFTAEREFDIGGTKSYEYIKGLIVEAMTLSVTPGQLIQGTFTFLGSSAESQTAGGRIASGVTSRMTNSLMNAASNVPQVLENNANYGAVEFSFNLQNNLRGRPQIGVEGNASIGEGKTVLTGTLRAYYSSATTFDRYLNDTVTSLFLQFADAAGNRYFISIPKVKFTAGRRNAAQANSDVEVSYSWAAQQQGDFDHMILIAREPA